tara:strand:- start:38 stop:532 length:495 start_codon:yes stop_codon:yes gene_type:complete
MTEQNQEYKVYSFQSVGETVSARDERLPSVPKFPIGVSTPLVLSSDESELFKMNTSLIGQIRDNFRNMVATNHGERLSLFDFGANLRPLVFELGTKDSADSEALQRIQRTTSKYMPFITLKTYEPMPNFSDNGDLAKMTIRVGFVIPNLTDNEQMIEIVLYAAG